MLEELGLLRTPQNHWVLRIFLSSTLSMLLTYYSNSHRNIGNCLMLTISPPSCIDWQRLSRVSGNSLSGPNLNMMEIKPAWNVCALPLTFDKFVLPFKGLVNNTSAGSNLIMIHKTQLPLPRVSSTGNLAIMCI